jgi:arylsulfatase A-like enzyme
MLRLSRSIQPIRRVRTAARVALRQGLTTLLAGSALIGCGGDSRDEPLEPARNIVLIVVDTLRRDRLGVHGAERPTTPALDRLAAESVRFDRAYATAPWTKPSVASMLTGLHPVATGMQTVGSKLPDDALTLAEILRDRGWSAVAIVSNFVLTRKNGFAQGFERFDQRQARSYNHVSTPMVTEQALDALDRLRERERPFFLFVHYFDPHYNYVPYDAVDFAPASEGRLDGTQPILRLRGLGPTLSEAELAWLNAVYDEDVRRTDDGIGRLLQHLDVTGLADDTLVVVTADHGEELLERGWLGHTRTLYEELIHVPLLVRHPGAQPRIVREPVSLVSLAPTLVELVGIAPEGFDFYGASLAGAIAGHAPRSATVYAEVDFETPTANPKNARKQALIGARHKLIRDERSGAIELYDLERDPQERQNLAESEPRLRDAMLRELDARARSVRLRGVDSQRLELDPDDIRMLEELGYIDEP